MRRVWVVALLGFAGTLMGLSWLAYCWLPRLIDITGPCAETLACSLRSPDGAYVASVFTRDCGATTAYVTHVNLRESDRSFGVDWKGVIADGCVLVRNQEAPIVLLWRGPRHLIVRCSLDEVFERRTRWRDVSISYQGAELVRQQRVRATRSDKR